MGLTKGCGLDYAGGQAAHRDEEECLEAFVAWEYIPGEDSCPFEPKACDWGWFEGRKVALDYSTPAWENDD